MDEPKQIPDFQQRVDWLAARIDMHSYQKGYVLFQFKDCFVKLQSRIDELEKEIQETRDAWKKDHDRMQVLRMEVEKENAELRGYL